MFDLKILDIANKVILMNEGKVEKYGDKEEVLTNVLKRENKICCKISHCVKLTKAN